jgi:pimeloyl-ACP methyl ester carboxylesterase
VAYHVGHRRVFGNRRPRLPRRRRGRPSSVLAVARLKSASTAGGTNVHRTRAGAPFADVLAATTRLRADPFLVWLGARWDEAGYLADQARYRGGVYTVDAASGLRVYVPDFEALLSRITVPVLALFGERDTSVDWRSTAALYARTMGANPRADLTVRTFPDGNPNLHRSRTDGLREMIDRPERRAWRPRSSACWTFAVLRSRRSARRSGVRNCAAPFA